MEELRSTLVGYAVQIPLESNADRSDVRSEYAPSDHRFVPIGANDSGSNAQSLAVLLVRSIIGYEDHVDIVHVRIAVKERSERVRYR